jgi:hypothetical protein
MTQLRLLESTTNDSTVGGFLVTFPSGAAKTIAWRSEAPIQDTLEASKEYAKKLIQSMIESGKIDDIERTNVPSLVAAIQKMISDWNEKQRARLYANAPTLQ